MSDLSSALTRAVGGTVRRAQEAATPSRQKGLLLRLDPAVHKRLKVLAAEHETTVQQLGQEALGLLFARYAGGTEIR